MIQKSPEAIYARTNIEKNTYTTSSSCDQSQVDELITPSQLGRKPSDRRSIVTYGSSKKRKRENAADTQNTVDTFEKSIRKPPVPAYKKRNRNGAFAEAEIIEETPLEIRDRQSITKAPHTDRAKLVNGLEAGQHALLRQKGKKRKEKALDKNVVHESQDEVKGGRKTLHRLSQNEVQGTIHVRETIVNGQEESEELHTVRSSGRQRQRTRKYLVEVDAPDDARSAPISTPSQRRRHSKNAVTTPSKAVDVMPLQPAASTHIEVTPLSTPSRKRGRPKKDSTMVFSSFSSSLPQENLEMNFKDVVNKNGPAADTVLPSSKRGHTMKLNTTIDSGELDISAIKLLEVPTADNKNLSTAYLKRLEIILHDHLFEEAFNVLKDQILQGLSGKRHLPLIGLDNEYQKVLQLVEQTIVAGEGNSMLVIGARGSAKTTLVESVLTQMTIEHKDEFYVVRLSGFFHTDDKLASKEVWRQLGREMEVDDDAMGSRSNYADTLTSLLALLSHPIDLLAIDEKPGQTTKSVVFIIEEFDLFTSHPRQTLLYNLFDIAQSRKAPIAVLGLTTKINVVESLEKRVKSRFSHRYVYLSMPKSFQAFRDVCLVALSSQPKQLTSGTPLFTNRIRKETPRFRELCTAWNDYISSLLSQDPAFIDFLRQIYTSSKSIPTFMSACYLPIMSMSQASIPTPVEFVANCLFPPDSKLHTLFSLSELELSLLIAAARLDVILDCDTCNFNMAYDEYCVLSNKMKLQISASGTMALGGGARIWGREVAIRAWERLELLELLIPALGGAGGVADVGRPGKLWKVDVGLEEIGACGLEMNSMMTKWCKEI